MLLTYCMAINWSSGIKWTSTHRVLGWSNLMKHDRSSRALRKADLPPADRPCSLIESCDLCIPAIRYRALQSKLHQRNQLSDTTRNECL